MSTFNIFKMYSNAIERAEFAGDKTSLLNIVEIFKQNLFKQKN